MTANRIFVVIRSFRLPPLLYSFSFSCGLEIKQQWMGSPSSTEMMLWRHTWSSPRSNGGWKELISCPPWSPSTSLWRCACPGLYSSICPRGAAVPGGPGGYSCAPRLLWVRRERCLSSVIIGGWKIDEEVFYHFSRPPVKGGAFYESKAETGDQDLSGK